MVEPSGSATGFLLPSRRGVLRRWATIGSGALMGGLVVKADTRATTAARSWGTQIWRLPTHQTAVVPGAQMRRADEVSWKFPVAAEGRVSALWDRLEHAAAELLAAAADGPPLRIRVLWPFTQEEAELVVRVRLRGLAAWTTTGREPLIALNPAQFNGLSAAQQTFVLAHELTHAVLNHLGMPPAPLWLAEGYADFAAARALAVALPAVPAPRGASLRRIGEESADEVRIATLWDPEIFRLDPRWAYPASAALVALLAQRCTPEELLAAYRIAGERTLTDIAHTAWLADLGWDLLELEQQWRRRMGL